MFFFWIVVCAGSSLKAFVELPSTCAGTTFMGDVNHVKKLTQDKKIGSCTQDLQ